MAETVRFREILRRLAIVDEGFADDQAGLGLGLRKCLALDPKTAALVRVGALAAIGSPEVCLEWSASQALRSTSGRSFEIPSRSVQCPSCAQSA
jgi:hypothetical protein